MNGSGYYLHNNGSLIHKTFLNILDLSESDFVVTFWYDTDISQTPKAFVKFLKEAREMDASDDEIYRLAKHNHLKNYVVDWEEQVFGNEAKY
jgi:hypothetical protein